MLRALATVMGTICLLALAATPAHAAVKRCGSAGKMYHGALTLAHVTARNTTCSKAKHFARSFTLNSGEESGFTCSEDFNCTWRGWACRNDGRSGTLKHHCENVSTHTHKIMVITWSDQSK